MTREYIKNLHQKAEMKANKERKIVRILTVYPIYVLAAIISIPALILALPALAIFGFAYIIDNKVITAIFKAVYRETADRFMTVYRKARK